VSKPRSTAILDGPKLLSELAVTLHPVKFLPLGAPRYVLLPSNQAYLIVKAGVYNGQARKGRVYKIWEVDSRSTTLIPDPSYWDDRACIRFHTDQTQIPTKIQRQRQADLWDQMLTSQPQLRGWERKRAIP